MRIAVSCVAVLILAAACDDGVDPPGLGPGSFDRGADALPNVDMGVDATSITDARVVDMADPTPDAAIDAQSVDMAVDMAIDAAPPPPADFEHAGWPTRDCTLTLRYDDAAQSVQVAGQFTNWADDPIAMQRDAIGFTVTLGPDDGLMPGQRYAYKIIVDGQWRIDPGAKLRKYDGDCVNSGLMAPACDAGPQIIADPVTASPEGAGQARFTIPKAIDGTPLAEVEARLDGLPIAYTLNAPAGEFTIDFNGLQSGRHVIAVRALDAMGRAAEPVELIFWVQDAPFDYRDGALYLLFIDRFANGNREIDDPVGDPVTYPADWHGGDLWGALAVLESGYFEQVGVNAIWLSPANLQVGGHFGERAGGGRRIAAYHGYWPIRGRAIDPRFGGEDALHAFVQAAHARGIRVLLDLINNQVHEQHEYIADNPEWFRTACVCGQDPGCGWSERPLDCLFAPYLPDINWREPGAEAQFISDALWWIDTFGVDGFRVDAVKHVETTSIFNLRAAIARRFEQGGTPVVMLGETAVGPGDRFDDGCGEIYPSGYDWISAYTGPNALNGQFDFPTHHNIQWGVLTGQAGYDQIEGAIAEYQRRYDPAALHVQFLGSHDSARMASRAAQDPATGCRFTDEPGCGQMAQPINDAAVFDRLKRAFTLLYTMPGIPLLYYGDDIALPGGNDPDSRRDMWWDGDLADQAMTDARPDAQQLALRGWIQTLAQARAAHPALTRGARLPLVVEPDLYVYARQLGDDVALVVLNRGADVQDRRINLGALAGAAFESVAGEGQARIDGNSVLISIGGGQSAIFAR
ncbi:MAG: glycosidase [Bradymonadia bacterium]|jgi:glycosidase